MGRRDFGKKFNYKAVAAAQTAFFWYATAGAAIAFLAILTLPETQGRKLP